MSECLVIQGFNEGFQGVVVFRFEVALHVLTNTPGVLRFLARATVENDDVGPIV